MFDSDYGFENCTLQNWCLRAGYTRVVFRKFEFVRYGSYTMDCVGLGEGGALVWRPERARQVHLERDRAGRPRGGGTRSAERLGGERAWVPGGDRHRIFA